MKGRKIMRINEDTGAVLVLLMVAFNGLFLSANASSCSSRRSPSTSWCRG